jgi:hypothetical protein
MFRRARNRHSDWKGHSLGRDCTSEGSWSSSGPRNVGPILTSAPEPKMGSDRVQPDIPELLQEVGRTFGSSALSPPFKCTGSTIGGFHVTELGKESAFRLWKVIPWGLEHESVLPKVLGPVPECRTSSHHPFGECNRSTLHILPL